MNIALRPQPFALETLSGRPALIDILRDGYSMVKIDRKFLAPRLAMVRDGMQSMTREYAKFEKLFPYIEDANNMYGEKYPKDTGLARRSDDEHKSFFHFAPDVHPLSALPVPRQSVYYTFFEALHQLNQKAVEIAVAVSEQFDERNHRKETIHKFPGSMAELIRKGWSMTRALQYHYLRDVIRAYAKPHTDRDALSIDLGASEPGLKILRNDGVWVDIDITVHEYVAVFPGRKFGAISRGALGDGTVHGVKYESDTNRDRFATVVFVHPADRLDDAAWMKANHERICAYADSLRIP